MKPDEALYYENAELADEILTLREIIDRMPVEMADTEREHCAELCLQYARNLEPCKTEYDRGRYDAAIGLAAIILEGESE